MLSKILLSSATGLLAVAAYAQTPASTNQNAKPQPPAANAAKTTSKPAAAGGLVVFVDPATGQIRQPSPSEIGALTQGNAAQSGGSATEAAASEPVMIQGPGNAVGAVLDDSSLSYMVVTKTAGGKLAMDCVDGEKAAKDRLKNAAQGARPAKKEVLDVQ
jgi:hypothetical protein